ncbi:MAG: adenosylmethionine-8-amino-7-oxononanoate aminotransferase, partial [Francisellaceae bacterium]
QDIAQKTGRLENIRSIGGMIAADLIVKNKTDKRYGFELYKIASSLGILLRPLGNTIYWAPPLNTALSTIDELSDITKKAIDSLNLD